MRHGTDLPIEQYMHEICSEVVAAAQAGDVNCNVTAASITLDVERLMIVSLIATEVVTNCLKHAFVQQAGGTIDLSLVLLDPAIIELTIRDDGRGLPPGYDRAREGLGTRILKGLAAQLQGRLTMSSDRATVTRLRFPALNRKRHPVPTRLMLPPALRSAR